MNKVTSIPYLTKKKGLVSFFILCCFFIFESIFSQKQWKRDYIWFVYSNIENRIIITFEFFDFEFGLYKEHGYLELCNFSFTTDGENYKSLARCEVNDQTFDERLWVKMTNKLPDTKILFYGCYIPKNDTMWDELTHQWVAVNRFMGMGFLTLIWYVPIGVTVKNFRVSGKWKVTGLYCPYYINDEIYPISPPIPQLNSETRTDLKQTHLIGNGIDYSNINSVKIFCDADAIVVSGAVIGENINVFTSSGVKIMSLIATNNFSKILLPANQIYIVKIGQARYKIAL